MSNDSPFHEGERAAQARAGMRDRIEQAGRRMIRDFMPEEHRSFFAELPFIAVGSIDGTGRPWASVLHGEPGFVVSPAPRLLMVGALPTPGDRLDQNMRPGAPLGVLGIQLETRRRNRVNGRVAWRSERGFELSVEQSFGNCKQYIQSRTRRIRTRPSGATHGGAELTRRGESLMAVCDTAFIASASSDPMTGGREGVDVSHRGGLPGFIRVSTRNGATRLSLPDYRGNFMFNTFGNLEVNPRAGLLCCDFTTGDLLSVTAKATVIWEGDALESFPGAERLLELEVQEFVLLAGGLGETWSEPEFAREFARARVG